MKTIRKIEAHARAGDAISNIIVSMIKRAKYEQALYPHGDVVYQVSLELNGVQVTVDACSDPALIYRDQQRAMKGYIPGPVGPECKPELTSADLANDLKICRQRECRAERAQSALQKKRKKLKDACELALIDAPALQMIDDRFSTYKAALESKLEQALKSGNESAITGARYNLRAAVFAEDWGRLMQKKVQQGRTIKQCAAGCSHLADYDGLSGAMVQWARRVLEQGWVYRTKLKELQW